MGTRIPFDSVPEAEREPVDADDIREPTRTHPGDYMWAADLETWISVDKVRVSVSGEEQLRSRSEVPTSEVAEITSYEFVASNGNSYADAGTTVIRRKRGAILRDRAKGTRARTWKPDVRHPDGPAGRIAREEERPPRPAK